MSNTKEINNVIGQLIQERRVVHDQDVLDFAKLSNDYNPIHLDEIVASKSIFKKRVAHGMYISSFFSKLLSDENYTGIYLSQNLKFIRPVYIGETVDVIIELISYNEIKSIKKFKTICKVNDQIVVEGIAEIYTRKIHSI